MKKENKYNLLRKYLTIERQFTHKNIEFEILKGIKTPLFIKENDILCPVNENNTEDLYNERVKLKEKIKKIKNTIKGN
ncbi:hypothetical protein CWI38_0608p0040 [Hamiltosporidium tvaerminnensis]|uniref:Uncharacterized protein n=2 Tax=Hamiltosporidium TaxID=1176354 RepID=A0A4V2JXR3_9MICR|nr:hypothetical protein CWI37_0339p0040 [Hamiltosporidium tvaerminnensis]TBU08104.1 hypothetical protein CWI39_0225p0010 [Hamiltosporidium magnivora]TBU12842.1 hypothetical protein CWI38_0608p0040 [Hamiltosporidium tvaerminnensis]